MLQVTRRDWSPFGVALCLILTTLSLTLTLLTTSHLEGLIFHLTETSRRPCFLYQTTSWVFSPRYNVSCPWSSSSSQLAYAGRERITISRDFLNVTPRLTFGDRTQLQLGIHSFFLPSLAKTSHRLPLTNLYSLLSLRKLPPTMPPSDPHHSPKETLNLRALEEENREDPLHQDLAANQKNLERFRRRMARWRSRNRVSREGIEGRYPNHGRLAEEHEQLLKDGRKGKAGDTRGWRKKVSSLFLILSTLLLLPYLYFPSPTLTIEICPHVTLPHPHIPRWSLALQHSAADMSYLIRRDSRLKIRELLHADTCVFGLRTARVYEVYLQAEMSRSLEGPRAWIEKERWAKVSVWARSTRARAKVTDMQRHLSNTLTARLTHLDTFHTSIIPSLDPITAFCTLIATTLPTHGTKPLDHFASSIELAQVNCLLLHTDQGSAAAYLRRMEVEVSFMEGFLEELDEMKHFLDGGGKGDVEGRVTDMAGMWLRVVDGYY